MAQDGASWSAFMQDMFHDLASAFLESQLNMLSASIARNLADRGITAQAVEDNVRKKVWGETQFIAIKTWSVIQQVALDTWGATQSIAIKTWEGLQWIGIEAAKAAASAWAALEGIPVVGPFIAPAAAAATLAGVLALAGDLRSAAGGFDVPAGLNPITQLHAKEMVLPEEYANVIRGLQQQQQGGAKGGGDVHLHVHALDSSDVTRFMQKNKGAVASAAWSAAHGGMLPRSDVGRRG